MLLDSSGLEPLHPLLVGSALPRATNSLGIRSAAGAESALDGAEPFLERPQKLEDLFSLGTLGQSDACPVPVAVGICLVSNV